MKFGILLVGLAIGDASWLLSEWSRGLFLLFISSVLTKNKKYKERKYGELEEIYNIYTSLIRTIFIYFSVGTDELCVVGTTYYASKIRLQVKLFCVVGTTHYASELKTFSSIRGYRLNYDYSVVYGMHLTIL